MYVRKVKRKCGIRGCKNTDSFAISLTREPGNSVIMCRSCLEKALKAVEGYTEAPKAPKAAGNSPPPLFFNHVALGVAENAPKDEKPVEEATDEKATAVEDSSEEQAESVYVCEKCGKAFKNKRGLALHEKSCESE